MPFMKSDSNDGCSTKKKNSVACVAHFASASAAFSRLARSDCAAKPALAIAEVRKSFVRLVVGQIEL